ncbi:MAG: cobyric acid synthase, partial [Actinobacteria bacterium]|nr:cobyric acid synthase [Actinomycetota bacterium]
MVVGTGSHSGKSVVAAALCRIYARRGLRVAPFKAQNMALNSYVTPEGGELGRAQAYQADAAGLEPHVDMNPVLLKPSSQTGSQVVVLGRPVGHMGVRDYHAYQPRVWPIITEALARLRSAYDLVVIEGAGSPAEINLRDNDIVNMRVAVHAQSPTLLVGDIDRGGVFASLVGTVDLLLPEERQRVKAFVINKFRGDATLLDPGFEFLMDRTGIPTIGVIPYLADWRGDEEDSLGIEDRRRRAPADAPLQIAVVRLPFVSNFTDFDALADEPDVAVRYVSRPEELAGCAAIVLPGTKSTVADLRWLREKGFARSIA